MKYLVILLPLILLSLGCENFFGEKTKIDFLDEPNFEESEIGYVPILPVWDDMEYPVDIIVGWDELIYIADSVAEEIISYDQAGNELGRFKIPGLIAIAQDRSLDILASGTLDTVIVRDTFTLPTIYRLDLNKTGTGGYGLKNAFIENKIVHPFYFKTGIPDPTDEEVSFRGMAPLGLGDFYVSRNGPDNTTIQFGGPDDAILLFNAQDELVSPVSIVTSIGTFRDFFKKPQGISSMIQPPQGNIALNQLEVQDFYYTSIDPDNVLRVQKVILTFGNFGANFETAPLIVGDSSIGDGFLLEPFKFERPVDVTVAGDGTNYVWVVDQAKDSVFQFSGTGIEGVNPPAVFNTDRNIRVSFGGRGEGLSQFDNPRAVTYDNEILYVADGGNGRILRFRLSSDFR
ncbi:MAG: hypothetical protein MRZ79_09365 [Bacteroidia bacterium]|nr:hypothetical protein [Bacteroidia bacterium]